MITAVVLTHNDELQIEKTLKSVSWCDEVMVLDDQSSDGTREIAKKFGARVLNRASAGDFAAQRNFALEAAKGDWILFVDSDEVISEVLQKEIQEVVIQHMKVGYFFKRQDYLYGKPLIYGETGSVRLLRLAQKNSGKWVRPVHEVWDVGDKTMELDNPILHYPHPDVRRFLSDINTYSTLNAQYLYKEKIRVPAWHIVVYPTAKFFRNYIWHKGYLDGTPGAILAIMMSFHSFLTRAKLYMLWHS
jgi:glycosyltransferase involved in cell wall biosynthesis